jgi:hypothetical protein
MTAEHERAAIVVWLRDEILTQAEKALEETMQARELEGIVVLMAGIELIPEMANAIERGDHHK